jgi:hypothetical protein
MVVYYRGLSRENTIAHQQHFIAPQTHTQPRHNKAPRRAEGSVVSLLCTTIDPLHTIFSTIFGASISETDDSVRARSHCRFVPLLIHFIPYLLTYSVALYLKLTTGRAFGCHFHAISTPPPLFGLYGQSRVRCTEECVWEGRCFGRPPAGGLGGPHAQPADRAPAVARCSMHSAPPYPFLRRRQ